MSKIKVIETIYKGYRFRSRLEARWAVFFDELGVEWEYEPEGFVLEGRGREPDLFYLPDFRVKCYGKRGDKDSDPFDLWIEVKGEMSHEDAMKILRFSTSRPVLVVGKIPDLGESCDGSALHSYSEAVPFVYPFNYETIDGDYFGAFPAADSNGHFYLFGDDSNYINKEDVDRVENAYTKARQARFEHGEKGK